MAITDSILQLLQKPSLVDQINNLQTQQGASATAVNPSEAQTQDTQNLINQQQPQAQSSWVSDLINARSQAGPRKQYTPVGFNFNRDPFDPSSYYNQLGSLTDASRNATQVSLTEAANKQAAILAAQQAQDAAAAQAALGKINTGGTVSNLGTVAAASGKAQSVISYGMKQLGKKYVFGAEGPNYFDCSGLMQYIFGKNGVKLPRTAAEQQRYATKVNSPIPGDLVFYGYPAHHVGLYIGNGKMLVAPHTGTNVKIQTVYGSPTYGRV